MRIAHVRRARGAGLEGAAAHVVRRLEVGARRDERRRALTVPVRNRPHERREAVLRSGRRPRGAKERDDGATKGAQRRATGAQFSRTFQKNFKNS